ncbi:hypothetical protein K439DRAFT_1660598 [Ramaria rubella]|nr:hypothetical protein K439DRAFT_1660598 [Ramaria rubella]
MLFFVQASSACISRYISINLLSCYTLPEPHSFVLCPASLPEIKHPAFITFYFFSVPLNPKVNGPRSLSYLSLHSEQCGAFPPLFIGPATSPYFQKLPTMTSMQDPALSRRSRKPFYTYSLVALGSTGGSFHLTAPAPAPPCIARIDTMQQTTSCSPNMTVDRTQKLLPMSRVYVPVERGRPTNIYIFRPTRDDIVNERRRDKARADAQQREAFLREEDERQESLMEVMPPPRKSTRIRARNASSLTGAAIKTEVKATVIYTTDAKGRRNHAAANSTLPRLRPPSASCRVFASQPGVTTSPAPSSMAPPEKIPSKKSLQKLQTKVNSRATERLITRGLAKAKIISVTSVTYAGTVCEEFSAVGNVEGMDFGVEVHGTHEMSGRSRTSVSPQQSMECTRDSPINSDEKLDTVSLRGSNQCPSNDTASAIKSAIQDVRRSREKGESTAHSMSSIPSLGRFKTLCQNLVPNAYVTEGSVGSSVGTYSSDTLCDVEDIIDIKDFTTKETLSTGKEMAHTVDFLPSAHTTPSSATLDTIFIPPSDPLPSNGKGKKHTLLDIDTEPIRPALSELRRSSRVIKKRRLT